MKIMKSGALGRGFSLMEMMIVLLIVAIIAAASAPMVTKKMSRNAGTGDSPWVFTGLSNNIAYLGGNNGQVLIGTASRPANAARATVYIAGRNNWSHIGFGNDNNTSASFLTFQTGNITRIGLTDIASVPANSVMLGGGQTLTNSASHLVAMGINTTNGANWTTAVGPFTNALEESATAIGRLANAAEVQSTALGFNAQATGKWSTAVGLNAKAEGKTSIALSKATASKENSIAIGNMATAVGEDSIAIGTSANAERLGRLGKLYGCSIAIGPGAEANDYGAIAIGHDATTKKENQEIEGDSGSDFSIAIGDNAKANHNYAVALGAGATTSNKNQIVLGTASDTVYIPGNLVVMGNAALGVSHQDKKVFINMWDGDGLRIGTLGSYDNKATTGNSKGPTSDYNTIMEWFSSDRRLKNVSKSYTAGLEELKKLEFFHYTFKKDEAKTPRVGVMAQDLQKVFPDAVTKGDDGFLRIRWEDMFYAVINAVKELDGKIAALVNDFAGVQNTIKAQQAQIDELTKQNAELEKRIEKLEKAMKKF